MTEVQKVTDGSLEQFLEQDLTTLDQDQKYLLFQQIQMPINYAITKVVGKFHTLPLERNDFLSIAWMAFEDVLVKYKHGRTRKSFVSYVIDAVYWKSMDYACSFINNKHKVLNSSSMELNWIENPEWRADLGQDLIVKMALEDYFESKHSSSLAKAVFYAYVYKTPLREICETHKISRNKLKKILTKTIADLNKLLT